ncbi:DUF2970 domain-containing protein [Alcaligenaceae bacterium LF4-65]|jgi:hypothetical protein|uniref:DUF2970 domain-containing protein n=1 Tax=Zwartia hollandica TaxID=324606 RepID=A0A953T3X3_9BURK|nr:DUF2970 domain-containing protein [Zwartia hollandica]MBZ1349866.1 DUF2970 domain-containing protein [Zwartia hollandica]
MSEDLKQLAQRKLNFFQTLKAVAWAMFGVRKGAGYQEDIAKLNPVHLVIAGLLFGVLFVTSLLTIVGWVLASFK